MHAMLSWRLHRGASMGTLDMLAGSTSVTATVTSQVQLGRFSRLGSILLIVWALSPLGGQATVRLIQEKPELQIVKSLGPTGWIPHGDLEPYMLSNNASKLDAVNSLFASAIENDNNDEKDLWGNIKIKTIRGNASASLVGITVKAGSETKQGLNLKTPSSQITPTLLTCTWIALLLSQIPMTQAQTAFLSRIALKMRTLDFASGIIAHLWRLETYPTPRIWSRLYCTFRSTPPTIVTTEHYGVL